MRLLDTYALYCGAKIDKPFIYESYFPLPFTKYVTFQAETPYDSRNYAYWQDVIDMIQPHLSQLGYQIIQLGLAKERPYQRVVDLRGQTTMHQLAYLTKGSSLHFGPDSFGVHLAGHYNVPIVTMYSISMPEVAGPHWGDKNKQVLIKAYERIGNGKPSYSPTENPKSINKVMPEELANHIFRLLGIDAKVPFETVFMGPRYQGMMMRELIPNHPNVMPMPEQPIEIRFDLASDEKILVHHLNYWQHVVLSTDKPISLDIVRQFKHHIDCVTYWVKENDNPEFVKSLVELGVNVAIVSELPLEQVQTKKIGYYEFGVINQVPKPNPVTVKEILDKNPDLYYRSCKMVIANGQVFGSHASAEANTPINNPFEYHKLIDSPKFWQDIDFYTVVKKLF